MFWITSLNNQFHNDVIMIKLLNAYVPMKQSKRRLNQTLLLLILMQCFPGPGVAQWMASTAMQKEQASPRAPKSLMQVLQEIKRHYGVDILYFDYMVEGYTVAPASIVLEKDVETSLNHLLKPLGLGFKKGRQGSYIIIRKSPEKKNLFPSGRHLPDRRHYLEQEPADVRVTAEMAAARVLPNETVRGVVTGEDGNGLPGVSILIKGTNRGTTTNADGDFQLENVDDQAVLVFSYVGFVTQELSAGNRTNWQIVLKEDSKSLKEVVVTALGLKREKRSLGYAVCEVTSQDLNKVPQENALGGLHGKVTGLQISNSSSEINAETHVYIRGTNSLTNNNDPLVVVDGIPSGNPNILADISADNIESISVLKGPSAAALYGSRAGNGVLLITTKSGHSEDKGLGVTFNTGYTTSVPYQYIDFQNRFTTGRRGIFDESAYQHWYGPEEGTAVIQWNTDGQPEPLRFYPRNRQNYFQNGNSFINDLSVGGSYDKGSFRVSLNQLSGNGTSPGLELNRYGVTLAAAYKLRKNLKVATNINVLNSFSDNFFTQQSGDFSYIDISTLPPHVDINELRDYWIVKDELQRNVNTSFNNPWFVAYERRKPFTRDRRIGNIVLNWEPIPDLTVMGRFAQNYSNDQQEELNPWSLYGINKPRGSYRLQRETFNELNTDVLVSYKKTAGDFYWAPSVGGNLMNQKTDRVSVGGNNLTLPGLFTVSNVERGGLEYVSPHYEKAIYSVYGMLTTGYKDFVYLDLTARNDWSSTLPLTNRSYFYPSASLSVLLSEFLPVPNWISLLKVRSGWAQVGKDTDPYLIHNVLNRGTWGDLTFYTNPSSLPNTQLKPEIATSFEIGADWAAWANRVRLEATYYRMQNKNQILNVSVSNMSGFNSATINAGVVENWGTEIGLRVIPVKQKALQWDLNINFTRDRNRLSELTEGVDQVVFWTENGAQAVTKVGEQLGDMYGYDALRVKEGPYAGWALLNANGKLQPDNSKLVKIGNYMHDFMLGFQTTTRYRRVTLSASFDWRQGGDFYSNTMQRFARSGIVEDYHNGVHSSTFSGILGADSFGGDRNALANEIKSRPERYRDGNVWIGGRTQDLGGFENNGAWDGAFFPGVISNGSDGYIENFGAEGTRLVNTWEVHEPGGGYWDIAIANRFVYDASFVKLRELSVSYDLPESLLAKVRIKKAAVSAFARNIILRTGAGIGIDPELAYMRRQYAFQSRGIERFGGAGPWVGSGGLTLKMDF